MLSFKGNENSCEGAEVLSISPHKQYKLSVLLLSRNDIKDRGTSALAKALCVTYGLEHQYLCENPLGEDSMHATADRWYST